MVPVVERALNAAYRERYQACPSKVIFGPEPGTPIAMLVEQGDDEWVVDRLDPEKVRAQVDEPVQAQEQLHQEVLERVRVKHARMRLSESEGSLPKLVVCDYVTVASVTSSTSC